MSLLALSAGRDVSAETRGRLDFVFDSVRGEFDESVRLRTCHRTETYVSGVVDDLKGLLGPSRQQVRLLRDIDAAEHLFRVASGLESLVVGEPQILTQVRRAYRTARLSGSVGPVLAGVFDRAIFIGRRVRSQTSLGSLGHSIGSVALVDLTNSLGDLRGRIGAVIGAGEAARDAARCLADAGARLHVLNRTLDRAKELAAAVGATGHRFDGLDRVLSGCEFVVVAIAEAPLKITVPAGLVVIDLSSPPAVEATSGLTVRTLDDLAAPDGPQVQRAIFEAESLISAELSKQRRIA
jgi:glutamyl-tRNA reductase